MLAPLSGKQLKSIWRDVWDARCGLLKSQDRLGSHPAIQEFMKRVAQLDVIRCTQCNAGSFQVLRAIAPVRQRLHPKLATGPPRS